MEKNTTYYYKCENCGYLTEIKNNNIAWCPNCTKRFSVYFKKWSLENNNKNIDEFKKELCIPYSFNEIKEIVEPNNSRKWINNHNGELIKRRTLLKEGFPLDRGGYDGWDGRQLKMYLIGIILFIGTIFLLLYLFNKL